MRRINTLPELERAVGPWPWRIGLVQASSAKPISRKTTLLLALVIFDGYELFPAHDDSDRKGNATGDSERPGPI